MSDAAVQGKTGMARYGRLVLALLVVLGMGTGGYLWYQRWQQMQVPAGFAVGNGRLEAIEVDVATKIAGRLSTLAPHEGDLLSAGVVIGEIDAADLRAQWQAAQASTRQAEQAIREAEAGMAGASSQLQLADKTLHRTQVLAQRKFLSAAVVDRDQTLRQSAMAGMSAAAERVHEASAAAEAAQARANSLHVNLEDMRLKAPVTGRVLYRLAEPGEVLAAGGKVLTLLDLSNVYMTLFLPTEKVGQVQLGAAARLLLDGLPGQAVPASVTFVAPKAQFTPREVETRTEREKLMFRLKVRVNADWLAQHQALVKPGMPGVAWIQLAPAAAWPASVPAVRMAP